MSASEEKDRSAGLPALEDVDVGVVHRALEGGEIVAQLDDPADPRAGDDRFAEMAAPVEACPCEHGQDRSEDRDGEACRGEDERPDDRPRPIRRPRRSLSRPRWTRRGVAA